MCIIDSLFDILQFLFSSFFFKSHLCVYFLFLFKRNRSFIIFKNLNIVPQQRGARFEGVSVGEGGKKDEKK